MADTVNTSGSERAPRELSMEVRLLLAFLLMGVVMFLTPYIFKSSAPVPPKKAAETTVSTTAPKAPPVVAEAHKEAAKAAAPAAAAPAAAAAKAAPPIGATPQTPLPPLIIDTDLYRVTFSNHGATVRNWVLKKYKGNDKKQLELVNTAARVEYPFSLYFPGQKPTADVNWAYYKQIPSPDHLGVTYEYSDGQTFVRKVFKFHKDSYLCKVSTEVTVDGKPVPNMIVWRGGFGDLTYSGATSSQETLYLNTQDSSLVKEGAKAAKNGPVTAKGDFSFAGIEDKYFAAVFLPESSANQTELTTFSNNVPTVLDQKKAEPLPGMAVTDGATNNFSLFVGPKDLNLLRQVNPKLVKVVDFGKYLGWMAKPLFLVLNWFNNTFVHNFGWSIVLVTVVINMLLFPLKLSNMKSMRKMQALKPQIDEINAKYKNVGLRDPRKAEQNQEVMALYKKHGVNPMGGCFPMLLQIPFFFAFWTVLGVAVEMRGASWLWVSDLSQAEQIPIHILPLIMIASQFFMQKMTPQANVDANQQKMMLFMPLIFGFMFYNFPSGLVLYYLTSNLVGIGQQWFFNNTATAAAAARSVEPPAKKKNGRK